MTWAAEDGHAYSSRLFKMTNTDSQSVINALRQIAEVAGG